MSIQIATRIEVQPGNKVLVPGCEPVSSLTSTTMDENRVCTTTVVDLADALAAIPGSSVQLTMNPRRKWFVFPSGPAPDPSKCDEGNCQYVPDWYAMLRGIGKQTNIVQPDRPTDVCSAFPLRGIFG